MRVRDEEKQAALFEATIKVVNQIGFASSSVSKIAKEAGISPATLYIYHKNKEDLLVSTYMQIKRDLAQALLRNLDTTRPIRDILETVWLNGFGYISKHRSHFDFAEQFGNSPFADLVNKTELNRMYVPLIDVFTRGIEQKILKNVNSELLKIFMIHPLMVLSNKRVCADFEAKPKSIEEAFDMAWDAIKL